jgi:hypothetical protein
MKFRRRTENGPSDARWRRRRRADPRQENPTHHPDLEPAHDQPWVPRSALTDRLRRSPRQ